ncbi:MAG: hypothetical protein N2235_02905 [Fischerella sp.]|nr:hypothetical protein [Fischerella sp.]
MIKHVGKYGDKKVVILYRQVPNEDHMCLVVYSDLLPRLLHDSVMKVLESPEGQASKDLADVLFRNLMADGRNILETLHREGHIKKVQTSNVLVTPTPSSSVRLDELNKILNEMAQGEEAVKRLADLDRNAGITGKKKDNTAAQKAKVIENPTPAQLESQILTNSADNSALSDRDLALQRIQQAERMQASAAQLLKESQRLLEEAKSLDPTLVKNAEPAKTTKTKKTTTTKKQTA